MGRKINRTVRETSGNHLYCVPVFFIYFCLGHYDKSDLPHCWYTWLMFSLIPIMFIAGMVVQLKKTGQGRDHREGKRKQQEKQRTISEF